jgi:predicted NBD/HSP70 family sugar kinase
MTNKKEFETMAARVRIGIDLGGTKIEGLALDEAGAEIARLRIRDAAAQLRRYGEGDSRSRQLPGAAREGLSGRPAAGVGGRWDSGDDCAVRRGW